MIESSVDTAKNFGHIVVCPNTSVNWRVTKLYLFAISLIALMIATGFYIAGLWLILPFTCLEIVLLVVVTYWVAHQGQRKEVITLAENRILVEKGHQLPKFSWEADLFWTRLIVEHSPHRGHPDKLYLRSKKQRLEIGHFLNEQEKKKLVAELRGIVPIVC